MENGALHQGVKMIMKEQQTLIHRHVKQQRMRVETSRRVGTGALLTPCRRGAKAKLIPADTHFFECGGISVRDQWTGLILGSLT